MLITVPDGKSSKLQDLQIIRYDRPLVGGAEILSTLRSYFSESHASLKGPTASQASASQTQSGFTETAPNPFQKEVDFYVHCKAVDSSI